MKGAQYSNPQVLIATFCLLALAKARISQAYQKRASSGRVLGVPTIRTIGLGPLLCASTLPYSLLPTQGKSYVSEGKSA